MDEILRRLGQLEAERAITSVLYAYGEALDYGDRDLFLGCFTTDAHYEVSLRIAGVVPLDLHGHDDLRRYFDSHTHAPAAWHKHITANIALRVDGDQASATSYFVRIDPGGSSGPSSVHASGRYLDELACDDAGTWRIRSRRCEVENL